MNCIYSTVPKRQGFLRRLICRHKVLTVSRWHRDKVPPHMQGKQLYVDRLKVHNFHAILQRLLNFIRVSMIVIVLIIMLSLNLFEQGPIQFIRLQ